jgi:hypothetical protein
MWVSFMQGIIEASPLRSGTMIDDDRGVTTEHDVPSCVPLHQEVIARRRKETANGVISIISIIITIVKVLCTT